MVVQQANELLKELSNIEEKIKEIEQCISSNDLGITTDEVLREIYTKHLIKSLPSNSRKKAI